MKAIITDIEGTTTDINFVHKVLFPYSQEHLTPFVTEHQDHPEVKVACAQVRELVGQPSLSLPQVIAQFHAWIAEDAKVTPLKTIQGLIWEEGFKSGHFRAHVYPDVEPYLQRWHGLGLSLHVYSSGSVQAQKLLFAHTFAGDLTPLFSQYFDTTIGGKKEVASYGRIAQVLRLAPQEICFLTDATAECEAALAAGYHVLHLCRDTPATEDYPWLSVSSFAGVDQALSAMGLQARE